MVLTKVWDEIVCWGRCGLLFVHIDNEHPVMDLFSGRNALVHVVQLMISAKVWDVIVLRHAVKGVLGCPSEKGLTLGFRLELDSCVVSVRVVINGTWHQPDSVLILFGNPGSMDLFLGSNISLRVDNILVKAEVSNKVVSGMLLALIRLNPIPLMTDNLFCGIETDIVANHVSISAEVGHEIVHWVGLFFFLKVLVASSRAADGVRLKLQHFLVVVLGLCVLGKEEKDSEGRFIHFNELFKNIII